MATLMYLVDGHFKLAIFEIDQSVQRLTFSDLRIPPSVNQEVAASEPTAEALLLHEYIAAFGCML